MSTSIVYAMLGYGVWEVIYCDFSMSGYLGSR